MTIEAPASSASPAAAVPDKPHREPAGPLALSLTVLAVVTVLALSWYYATSLLLLFAGILFAVLLDACTRGLARVVPLTRPWRFGLVMLLFGCIVVLAIGWGLDRAPTQVRSLFRVMDTQLGVLEGHLAAFDIDLFGPGGRQDLSHLIADPGRLFGHVHYAVSGAYAVAINTIVIVCLGLFFAGSPAGYREGALKLVPISARVRVRSVLNEMGQMLRGWLLGQLLRGAVVAALLAGALYLLGVPGAGLLGLQAGVANFIPYLGPLIAAFPVALVAMPLGLSTLAWVMIIYFTIQTIEGFVIAPLIQKGAVNVAPAWTLFAIVVLGAMFGAMGMALAAPLVAIGRIAVLRFYVEDWLKDRG
ncbi:MAG: AI-2E family transporter [Alphaproteobacteria bacterium]|jgi:predicted PurR-regulated permease PerM|nr:AI-2E family transporter [Alphaproteobacteria bacterium]